MAADVEPGQLVPYAPRSRRVRQETARALNLANAPTGVEVATPAAGQIWARVTTRRRRGKTESSSYALPEGLIFAGLGILALYEIDKAVSAWAGSLNADLQGLDPLNWLKAGMNAQTAMVNVKAAAAAAAEQAATAPPVASSPPPQHSGGGGSNVGQVAGAKLGAANWDDFWATLGSSLRKDFQKHPFGGPF